MYRMLTEKLLRWQTASNRMPLILRGARQTGKTHLIEQFAKQHFARATTINFEEMPRFKACFTELNPEGILQQITAITRQELPSGESLLFLDEIQECPRAIQALRYFKESYPQLHVIAAGSLLEFALNGAEFRMPVGRIEFLHLYPLSFIEFLQALGYEQLLQMIQTIHIGQTIPLALHQQLLELVNLYLFLGGMPAVIQSYLDDQNFLRCQQLQAFLLNTYRNDFGKYASLANQKHCQRLFAKAPALLSKQFKYVDIDPDVQSRSLKAALQLLIQAEILLPVYATQANTLPLNATINEKTFKLLFLDVGLANHANQIDISLLQNTQLLNRGAITEQFVGQELLVYESSYEDASLYFWKRDQRGATAEVDYIVRFGEEIIPIEVKSGKAGTLRSLRQFVQEHQNKFAIKISQDPFTWNGQLLSLPLYMVSEWQRLIKECLDENMA